MSLLRVNSSSMPSIQDLWVEPKKWHQSWTRSFSPTSAFVTWAGTRMAMLDGKPVRLDSVANRALFSTSWPCPFGKESEESLVAGMMFVERVHQAYKLTDIQIRTGNCFTRVIEALRNLFAELFDPWVSRHPRFGIEERVQAQTEFLWNAKTREVQTQLNEGLSITPDMVAFFRITGQDSKERYPGHYYVKVILKDGREKELNLPGPDVYTLLKALNAFFPFSNELEYLAEYADFNSKMGWHWTAQSAEEILSCAFGVTPLECRIIPELLPEDGALEQDNDLLFEIPNEINLDAASYFSDESDTP